MKDKFTLRSAEPKDASAIWSILQQAIQRRKTDGSTQWQEGYPNLQTVEEDIKNKTGYVYESGANIAAYAAIIFEVEPAYEIIKGHWESKGEYGVVHRVAVSDDFAGQGIATKVFSEIENVVRQKNVSTIKVDTNFDNAAMLKIFEKLGYKYRGKVYFRGSERLAYEKML